METARLGLRLRSAKGDRFSKEGDRARSTWGLVGKRLALVHFVGSKAQGGRRFTNAEYEAIGVELDWHMPRIGCSEISRPILAPPFEQQVRIQAMLDRELRHRNT